jgi:hypothetical protein
MYHETNLLTLREFMVPLCQSALSAFHDCENRSDLRVVSFCWPSLNVDTQYLCRNRASERIKKLVQFVPSL